VILMVNFSEVKCGDFIKALASKSPTPGGGGAAAFGGAIGMALGNMVGNLTIGKKKYAKVEEEIKTLLVAGEKIIADFMLLVDQDAACFEPLAKAYGLPKDTQEQSKYKDEIIEKCCKNACLVPMEIMHKTREAILLLKRLGEIGNIIAISDIACGATFLKSALIAAKINVLINFNYLKDQEYIITNTDKMNKIYEEVAFIADEILSSIITKITS
jgi:formiminotetrahydrofolate cyclodeaminase